MIKAYNAVVGNVVVMIGGVNKPVVIVVVLVVVIDDGGRSVHVYRLVGKTSEHRYMLTPPLSLFLPLRTI